MLCPQVVLVGDLNVAAEKRDVHPSINYDQLYDERELQVSGCTSVGLRSFKSLRKACSLSVFLFQRAHVLHEIFDIHFDGLVCVSSLTLPPPCCLALQLLHAMLSTYPDVWRRFHPQTDGCYTVWEVRSSAVQSLMG